MKKIVIFLMCFICMCNTICLGYTEKDLINALNKTYTVGNEKFTVPSSIKNKITNYIKANDITEEQCNELMDIIDEAIDFASDAGTTDIKKLTPDQIKEAISIVNKAADVLDVEVKVNSSLDKVTATDKETGKIVEEIEHKEVFFKSTGGERNTLFWCFVGGLGLIIIIIAYIIVVKKVKKYDMTFVCNSAMIIYIVCAMPLICFGNYIEVLDLLKPFLSSEVGDGYVDIVDVEIKEPVEDDISTKPVDSKPVDNKPVDNKPVENKPVEDKPIEEKPVDDKPVENKPVEEKPNENKPVENKPVDDIYDEFKTPKIGEMYAKLRIPSCDIDLPVYYGDNEKILEAGVGHYSGSHFPGQGKGILYTTHNTKDKLYNLMDIKFGAEVNVVTNFGKFTYKVTDVQIIDETDKNKAYINSNKELLMIYTCYPFDSDKYTNERCIVYCERSDV